MTMAKGLTSGYQPLAAVGASQAVADAFVGGEAETFVGGHHVRRPPRGLRGGTGQPRHPRRRGPRRPRAHATRPSFAPASTRCATSRWSATCAARATSGASSWSPTRRRAAVRPEPRTPSARGPRAELRAGASSAAPPIAATRHPARPAADRRARAVRGDRRSAARRADAGVRAHGHGMTVRSVDPWTSDLVFTAPSASATETAAAAGRAATAAPAWAATPVEERAEALRRFAGAVEADARALAELIVREVGKRRADAEGEVAWTAASARWYADHPPAPSGPAAPSWSRARSAWWRRSRQWNVPLITPAWKWLPALVAGNVVVWKPSERATATCARRAGAPAGGRRPGRRRPSSCPAVPRPRGRWCADPRGGRAALHRRPRPAAGRWPPSWPRSARWS